MSVGTLTNLQSKLLTCVLAGMALLMFALVGTMAWAFITYWLKVIFGIYL